MDTKKFPAKWQEIDRDEIQKIIGFVRRGLRERPDNLFLQDFLYVLYAFAAAAGEIERLQRICNANGIVTTISDPEFIERLRRKEEEEREERERKV